MHLLHRVEIFVGQDHVLLSMCVIVPSFLDSCLHLSVFLGRPAEVTQEGGQDCSFDIFFSTFLLGCLPLFLLREGRVQSFLSFPSSTFSSRKSRKSTPSTPRIQVKNKTDRHSNSRPPVGVRGYGGYSLNLREYWRTEVRRYLYPPQRRRPIISFTPLNKTINFPHSRSSWTRHTGMLM